MKTKTQHISLMMFLLFTIQNVCFADITKLPGRYQKELHDISHFKIINSGQRLPPPIFALCADDKGKLADPGKKWEVTDVIADASLPHKRLIWAATDGSIYVVHYERGGYAHSYHILVAILQKGENKPSFVWRGVGGRLKDYKSFIDALDKNSLDDRLDYAH